jgi:tRNA (guanine37-N1)-methyltransferase
MIRFEIVTVFPETIEQYCRSSILGRAQKQGLVEVKAHNLRDWATDKHHTVDDRVFGGGPGMLMKVEPLYKAITSLRQTAKQDGYNVKVIATTASGKLFNQKTAATLANPMQNTAYIILCGHYEGFDTRIFEFVDEQITVGPYILTGGELPALIIVDAVTRLIPSVLGNDESAQDETTFAFENGKIVVSGEHPQYTMPASFSFEDPQGNAQTRLVPELLRSGHHQKIKAANESQRSTKDLVIE